MRKLLIWFIIIFIQELNAQSYVPMLGVSNEWYELVSGESGQTYIYLTKGNTTIRDKTYKIIGGKMYDGNMYNNFLIVGYMREDTIEKKIYMISNSVRDTSEIIYFDFSLNENDSIMLYSLNYDTLGYFRVDSVRNFPTLAGNRRALFLINDDWSSWLGRPLWVEGIGTLRYFEHRELSYIPYDGGFVFDGGLTCYFKDGIKIYQSDYFQQFDTCVIFWSSVEDLKSRSEILIFPNPASSEINIVFKNDLRFSILIYNSYGRLQYKAENQKKINLDNFSAGMYIIKIQINNGILTRKLLVIK